MRQRGVGQQGSRRIGPVVVAGGLVLASCSAGGAAGTGAGVASRASARAATSQEDAVLAPLTLVGQTSFVRAGGEFTLTARISRETANGDVEAVASVFPALPNRSAFAATLAEPPERLPLGVSTPAYPDAEGLVSLRLPLADPAAERDPERVRIGRRNGVHPVIVEVRDRDAGPVRSRMTTFLVHLVEPDPATPLLFSLVVPTHRRLTGAASATELPSSPVDALANALDAARPLPLTLAPTPQTLDAVRAAEPGSPSLGRLRSAAQSLPVVASPYVPVDVPALLARGLSSEVERQFEQGRQTLASVMGRIETDTWVSDQPLDSAAVDHLARRGATRMIVPEALLAPIDRQVTLTSPFLLRGGGVQLPAVAADDGLTAHFGPGDQTLRAHQLLADLAVLFLDLPGARRGALALPPSDWTPTPAFFDVLRPELASNPILRPAFADELFDLPSAESGRSTLLVRRPAQTADPLARLNLSTAEVLTQRRQIQAMGTILGQQSEPVAALDKILLTAESSELAAGRTDPLRRVREAVARQKGEIRIPQGRSVTFTSREGSVPVTFQNDTGLEASVAVSIASDKLSFPEGATKRIVLTPRLNTTDRFRVVARTSGSFPVSIRVESVDGTLLVGRADLTVRSTAAPGLGLGIALGAAGFLVVWWGRNAHRVRRARGLVAGSPIVAPEEGA